MVYQDQPCDKRHSDTIIITITKSSKTMDHRGVFLVLSFLLALIGCVVGFLPSTPKVFRRQHQLAMTVAPSDTFALLFDCDGVIVETGRYLCLR